MGDYALAFFQPRLAMASCSRSSSPLPFRCFGAQDDGCSPSKAEAVGLRRVLWGGAIAGAVALGYTLAVPPGGIAGPHTLMYAPTVLRPALSAQGLARAWARRPGPASARSRPSSSAHAAAPLPDAPTSREVPAPATLTPRSLWPHSVSFAFAVALAAAALSAWRLRPRSPATLEQIGLLSVAGARDRWVDDARSAPAVPGAGPLAGAKTQASELLQTAAVPSARVEDWRFTDLGALQGCALVKSPAAGPGPAVDVTACTCDAAATSRVVLVDGVVARALSDLSGLPDGVYVGPASVAPAPYAGAVADHFARQTAAQGAFFAQLNTALCPDVLCCIVRAGTRVPHPVHVIHVTQARSPSRSRSPSRAPRSQPPLLSQGNGRLRGTFSPIEATPRARTHALLVAANASLDKPPPPNSLPYHPHTLLSSYCMFLPALFETKHQLKGTGRMSAMLCSPVSLQVVQ